MPRPAPRYANPASFKVGHYNEQHRKNLSIRAKKVERLYRQAVQKIAAAAQPSLFGGTPGQEFSWRDFPALSKEVDALTREMTQGLQLNIEQGDKEAWALSNTKNNAMVAAMVGKASVPKAVLDTWKAPNLAAMNAFIARKEAGMNLSQRVWNLAPQFKAEMELALETCIGRGMSAAEISREVRQYLNEPNRLFRRVRDEQGVLRLSKAAAAYHPGQGVYRSSYKNALRMTATENNIAYRTADHGRWNALPFVLGIEISTSNNHPVEDICDELAGRYPKDFKFTGWHPWCRCFAVAVLANQKEMDAYTKAMMNGDDVSQWKFTGEVKDMPEGWNTWMTANAERIMKAKSLPYFIKDNFTDGDPTKGLRWKTPATTTAAPKKLTPQEIAAKRHAARTPEQAQQIRDEWNKRRRTLHDAERTLTMARKYVTLDKTDVAYLEQAIKKGHYTSMRANIKFLRAQMLPIKRAELELQRLERQMLSDTEIKARQRGVIQRRIDDARAWLRGAPGILEPDNSAKKITFYLKGFDRHINEIKSKMPAKSVAAATTTSPLSMGVKFYDNYPTRMHVDKTLQAIDDALEKKGEKRWFPKGKVRLSYETDPNNNGSTYRDGRIMLQKERMDRVQKAFAKIGKGAADTITYNEADAMSTLWHEITHNRNTTRWIARTDLKVRYMELANEFVARATLPEFYGRMGVDKMPHPSFMTERTSTSYNKRVRKYSQIIDDLKLDRDKATEAVKKYLFNESYDTQVEGLKDGLVKGGLKHLDGTAATPVELAKIMDYCQDDSVSMSRITTYLKAHKFITK